MAFDKFKAAMAKAIEDKVVAQAGVVASCPKRNLRYEEAFGNFSLKGDGTPVQADTIFKTWSATKLITAIATLQSIQAGLLRLDEPISTLLPTFDHPRILTPNPDTPNGPPTTIPSQIPITISHLLTHTSGLTYPSNSLLHSSFLSLPANSTLKSLPLVPQTLSSPLLLFEPGSTGNWTYGTGFDIAGQLVEKVNSGQRLGEYMSEHIFAPLGLKSTTFDPFSRPDITARIGPRVQRVLNRKLVPIPDTFFPDVTPEIDEGGSGIYTTAGEFAAVLESLLNDDGKLLESAYVEELVRPRPSESEDKTQKIWSEACYVPAMCEDVEGGARSKKWNICLGGLVVVDGVEGVAGKGSVLWTGLANAMWFLDRESGTCAFYATHLIPSKDGPSEKLFVKPLRDLFAVARS